MQSLQQAGIYSHTSVGHKEVKPKQYLITLDEFDLFKSMGQFNNRKGYLKFIMIKFSKKKKSS